MRAQALVRTFQGARPPGVIELAASERSLLDVEAEALRSGDTCLWLDDGRLFVEQLRGFDVQRFWIDFDPPRVPVVHAASWSGDRERRPTGHGYLRSGRAWVNSRGEGVGTPEGTDVILEAELQGTFSASDTRRHVALLLDARSLRRER